MTEFISALSPLFVFLAPAIILACAGIGILVTLALFADKR